MGSMGRRPASFRATLSFRGRVSPAVGLLLAGIFSASILAALLPAVRFAAALVPEALAAGQLWRLGTWAFVEVDPINLVFALLVLFWLGRDLSLAWGER